MTKNILKSELKKGFTLVEMMIVVAIIAVLAGVALPQYNKYVKKSETVEGVSFMRQIADAEVLYKATHGSYFAATTADAAGITAMKTNLGVEVPTNAKFNQYKVEFCSENGGGFMVIGSTATIGSDYNKPENIYYIYPKNTNGSIFINNYVNGESETANVPTCTTP